MWQDLWVALAMILVIEGVLPFLNPPLMRRALLTMAQMNDHSLRISGLICMLVGVGLLYLLRA